MSKVKKWRIYNRKVLVDPFQIRLAGVAVCHFMLVVLIFIITLFAPIIVRLESGDITAPHVQAAAHDFLVLHNNLWLPLLGALILLVLHNLLVTHRVAGPLYRFRLYLKAVGDGDLSSPIRFRRSDYLENEAKVASNMVESLRGKVVRMERQLERAGEIWTDLRSSLADGVAYELQQKIEAMDDTIEECRGGLIVFKTKDERTPSAKSASKSSEEPVKIKV